MVLLTEKKTTNFVESDWAVSGEDVTYGYGKVGLRVINRGDTDCFLRSIIPVVTAGTYKVTFAGESRVGSSGVLYMVDAYNHVLGEATIASESLFFLDPLQECALLIKVFPHSEIEINNLQVELCDDAAEERFLSQTLRGDVAVVVPTYPTQENKYLCAFVHARVKSYLQAGISCDVICAYDYGNECAYEFEGVSVLRIPLDKLLQVFEVRDYQTILLHFFDPRYANMLDRCHLENSQLIIWSHNPETRYWDWPSFTTPYFTDQKALSNEQVEDFTKRDAIIKRYNEKENVSWVFVSDELWRRSEELIGITFGRAHVIPNLVDESIFTCDKKDPELRKSIFFLRKFDNVATYSVDIGVQCILELKRRDFFKDLKFNIYGTGDYFDELVAPVAHLDEVHLHKHFLSRDEIARVHAGNGIAFFPTRFDSQGVSMGEAAMSGLAVVSSNIDAAKNSLPESFGLLCDPENPIEYADAIERLYRDPDFFQDYAAKCHEKVYRLFRREMTTDKEIELIRNKTRRSEC